MLEISDNFRNNLDTNKDTIMKYLGPSLKYLFD